MIFSILAIIRAITSITETVVLGRKQGAHKKEIAVDVAKQVLDILAQRGVVPASLPEEEIGDRIDEVVGEQNKQGWPILESSSRMLVSVVDVIRIIEAARDKQ